MSRKKVWFSAVAFVFLPFLAAQAQDVDAPNNLTISGGGNSTANNGPPPAPEVALWISSNTSGLPLDLSTDTYVSLLMDSRYSLTWSEGAPRVTDTAPGPMSTFVSAYPPDLSRERHLATYYSGRAADSNQLLSDPLNLGDAVAAHFATIASAYGGLDIDVENFGRSHLSAYRSRSPGRRSPRSSRLSLTARPMR